MIDINDITVRIGAKTLFEHASAHISDGQKVGLVGPNGCGKSTLFRVLQGELETETGDVSYPNSYKIVSVAQEFKHLDLPILDFVLAQDKELMTLTERLKTAPSMELPEIHERLNAIEASSASARAAAILNGLGFKNEDLTRPLQEFSGGWRMRLALAAALFQPSDILLLDEPTNHLDLETSIWLIAHLRKYGGTLILISHDKEILNSLCDYIVHVEGKKLVSYTGNYDTFQKNRLLQRQLLGRAAEKQEKRRQHLQSFVDRFRYKATKAKQAQSRLKMIAKLQEIPEPEQEVSSHFTFPNPVELVLPLMTLDKVSCGYGEHIVLRDLSLRLVENDRIALLGANGNGKSTFAKLISGKIKPMAGEIHRSPKLKVGYFAQHQTEELPINLTAAAFMASIMLSDTRETVVRAHLARFGLTKEKALTKIENLSGGEKARLLFAAMTYDAPALLILDEPTNHLDIPGRDALIDALNAYTGSVILITHDLNLIQLIADDLWLVKGGYCKEFKGDLNDYRQMLSEDKRGAKKDEKPKNKQESAKFAVASDKPAKPSFNEIKAMKGQLARLDKKLTLLNEQKNALESLFLTPLSPDKIVQTQKDLACLAQELNDIENEWLVLSEQLEILGIK